MMGLVPIYTAENIKIADQLNWSLSVFWHEAPFSNDWLPVLQQVTEADGVRILERRFVTPTCGNGAENHDSLTLWRAWRQRKSHCW
jgi:hypothetical protein